MEKLVPRLRFPGFEGNWEKKKIIDVAPLQRGFDLPIDNIQFGEYPVVFSNGILKKHIEFKAVAPGVVTGRSGTIGKITYVTENYWPHNTSLWVTDFKGNYPKYVYYFYLQFDLAKFGTGSGVPTLNRNDVHSQNATIPSFQEQKKIAETLTTVDEKLNYLKKKKALLEKYKKGMMQKIFNQEVRFKDEDCKDFGDWNKIDLQTVGEIITGKTPSTADESLWEGSIQFVTPTDINEDKYQMETSRHISESNKTKLLPPGSIMFTCIASIGKMSLSTEYCITNQQINSIIVNNNYDNELIYYSLLNLTPFIKSLQANTTLPIINKTEFGKIKLVVPSDRKEQGRVANFLTAIDDKIDLVLQEIEKMEVWKKGLLAEMFI